MLKPDLLEPYNSQKEISPFIPDSHVHDPNAIRQFVRNYLNTTNDTASSIKAQICGLKTYNNPELTERFLKDLFKVLKETAFKGQILPFIIDDSTNLEASQQIVKIANNYGLQYENVKSGNGFVFNLMKKMTQKIQLDNSLSLENKVFNEQMCRAIMTDKMKALKSKSFGNLLELSSNLKLVGGVYGTQNIGYLYSIYLAGKNNYGLGDVTVTINEDDQRYVSLSVTGNSLNINTHDWFDERASWFLDPKTFAIVTRYCLHPGNPMTTIRDIFEICSEVIKHRGDSKNDSCVLFDINNDTFRTISTYEAFRLLPEALLAVMERQPILGFKRSGGKYIGLYTAEYHYSHLLDLKGSSKLDLGGVTFRASVLKDINVPVGGLADLNLANLIRLYAVKLYVGGNVDRAVRRDVPFLHQRSKRQSVYGLKIVEALQNEYSREQLLIEYNLEKDVRMKQLIKEALELNTNGIDELNIRKIKPGKNKLEEIVFWLNQLSEQISTENKTPEEELVFSSIKDFIVKINQEKLNTMLNTLFEKPTDAEIEATNQGIENYFSAYHLWKELVNEAYKMGLEDSNSAANT